MIESISWIRLHKKMTPTLNIIISKRHNNKSVLFNYFFTISFEILKWIK
jgi:hypothetical protein